MENNTISEAFDDVLIRPRYSDILPEHADTKTRLTKGITINIPFVSAAMDTVTEYKLAIAMARAGGIGIIHKNLPIECQADHVRKTKRAQSGLIHDPIKITEDKLVSEAVRCMLEERVGGIPVVNDLGILVGIITNRDVRSGKKDNLFIRDVMTKKVITIMKGASSEEIEQILDYNKIEKLPMIDKDNKLLGLYTYKDITNERDNPYTSKDGKGRLLVGGALGVTPDMLDRARALYKAGVDVVCLDTAHGHSKGVIDGVKMLKDNFPELQVIAGNIVTGEGAEALIIAGADAVKVGIGPGSICTTRVVTGVGRPQIGAIKEVCSVADENFVPVIADGGIKFTGDAAKAIVAGASSVMMGSAFAGCHEAPGEVIYRDGKVYKSYRGMGSIDAMKNGSKDRYFQNGQSDSTKFVPEGVVGMVCCSGSVKDVIHQYVGGLRSAMGYTGSKTISDLKTAEFIDMTSSGIKESHPHSITITKESPNYSVAHRNA